MATLELEKDLESEGTISFRLTPIENGKQKLYLVDVGHADKDRITLSVTKNERGERQLLLAICNDEGSCLEKAEDFPEFKLGSAFDIELVWNSELNKIAVFLDNEQKLELVDSEISINNLGTEIHYGEDIMGNNKSEMVAD